jgi:hypothetical protein
MDSSALRCAILQVLELYEQASGRQFLQEATIAAVVGAPLDEVQTQLERLEHDELVLRVADGSESSAARVTYHRPCLRLIAGHLVCLHGLRPPRRSTVCPPASDLDVRRLPSVIETIWNLVCRWCIPRRRSRALETPRESRKQAQLINTDEARQDDKVRDVATAYNDFWWDRATNTTTRRTSLITDPAEAASPR